MKQIKLIHLVSSGATMLAISVLGVVLNVMPLSLLPNDILTIIGTLLLVTIYANHDRIVK